MIYTVKKFKETKYNKSRPTSGAPKKISSGDISWILRNSAKNSGLTSTELVSELNMLEGKSISPQYLRSILYKNNLRSYKSLAKPFLTPAMKRKRLEFAKKYAEKPESFRESVFYSDETYIQINLGTIMNRVRRFRGSNPLNHIYTNRTVKHPIKGVIWGCFCLAGPGRLQICDEYINATKYLQILETKLKASISEYPITNPIHLDDSAPCHRTKQLKE